MKKTPPFNQHVPTDACRDFVTHCGYSMQAFMEGLTMDLEEATPGGFVDGMETSTVLRVENAIHGASYDQIYDRILPAIRLILLDRESYPTEEIRAFYMVWEVVKAFTQRVAWEIGIHGKTLLTITNDARSALLEDFNESGVKVEEMIAAGDRS